MVLTSIGIVMSLLLVGGWFFIHKRGSIVIGSICFIAFGILASGTPVGNTVSNTLHELSSSFSISSS